MKITVIGCGRWGSLITWYLDSIGHQVTLYGRAGSARMERFLATRANDLLTLPESVSLTTDLSCTLDSEVIIISIGAQGLQALFDELRPLELKNKTFVLCMKGIEISTGRRLSQIAEENVDLCLLRQAVKELPPREREIICLRFGLEGRKELTQKEVAQKLGISQSYISRLEKKIIRRLKEKIETKI